MIYPTTKAKKKDRLIQRDLSASNKSGPIKPDSFEKKDGSFHLSVNIRKKELNGKTVQTYSLVHHSMDKGTQTKEYTEPDKFISDCVQPIIKGIKL